MKKMLAILIMFLVIQTGYAELLTKQEIASEIGSRTSLSLRQTLEVTEIVYEFMAIIEEEYDIAIEEAVDLHEAEVKAIVADALKQYKDVQAEKDLWKTIAIIEAGALVATIIYAIVK